MELSFFLSFFWFETSHYIRCDEHCMNRLLVSSLTAFRKYHPKKTVKPSTFREGTVCSRYYTLFVFHNWALQRLLSLKTHDRATKQIAFAAFFIMVNYSVMSWFGICNKDCKYASTSYKGDIFNLVKFVFLLSLSSREVSIRQVSYSVKSVIR